MSLLSRRRSAPPFRPAGFAEPSCTARSSTSASRRSARASSAPSSSTRCEPFYPLHVRICERVPARPARGVRAGGGDLPRLRLLLVLLGLWVAHARRYADMIASASASARRASSSSWPRTTATCFSTSSSADSRARDRSGRQRRRGGARSAASRRSSTSSAPAWPTHSSPKAARRPDRGQQRPCAGSRRSTTSSPGIAILLGPARGRDDRGAAPRPADRGSPVRHDLPRALLVLLVDDARAAVRPPTGSRSSTSRSSRPTAARSGCTSSSGDRRTRSGLRRASCSSVSARGGYAALEGYAGFAGRVASRRSGPPRAPDRAPRATGSGSSATAPPGRETRCSTTAASDRSPRLHRRPQSVQARAVPARHAHSDPSSEHDRRDATRLHPDPALEPESARSPRSSRTSASGERS